MNRFYRTFGDPGYPDVRTHLNGIADSSTLCGMDTSGDDLVHDKDPIALEGFHRVTCPDCHHIIHIVRDYLKET